MRRARISTAVMALGLVALLASRSSAQAPAAGGRTLWHALGIPQGWSCMRDATLNRFGNFPGLEKKPPLKKLADPANLASENKALKTAARIKKEEDLAPQKKKALKYLAKMGCGCYPGVAEAFVESLGDCTEDVRLTAVEAIQEAAGNGCAACNNDSCCAPEVVMKLAELAFERDEHGCWMEPSEEVRAAAREALMACCPHAPPLEILDEEAEAEQEQQGDPGADDPAPRLQPDASASQYRAPPAVAARPRTQPADQPMSLGAYIRAGADRRVKPAVENRLVSARQPGVANSRPKPAGAAAVVKSAEGKVLEIDRQTGLLVIGCHKEITPLNDHGAYVFHRYLLGTKRIAKVQIIQAAPGRARARILDKSGRIAPGDTVRLKVEDTAADG